MCHIKINAHVNNVLVSRSETYLPCQYLPNTLTINVYVIDNPRQIIEKYSTQSHMLENFLTCLYDEETIVQVLPLSDICYYYNQNRQLIAEYQHSIKALLILYAIVNYLNSRGRLEALCRCLNVEQCNVVNMVNLLFIRERTMLHDFMTMLETELELTPDEYVELSQLWSNLDHMVEDIATISIAPIYETLQVVCR